MSMNCLFLNIFSFMLLNINILCIERQFHTLEQIAKNFPMMISNYQKYPVFEFNLSNNINIMLQNISTFFLTDKPKINENEKTITYQNLNITFMYMVKVNTKPIEEDVYTNNITFYIKRGMGNIHYPEYQLNHQIDHSFIFNESFEPDRIDVDIPMLKDFELFNNLYQEVAIPTIKEYLVNAFKEAMTISLVTYPGSDSFFLYTQMISYIRSLGTIKVNNPSEPSFKSVTFKSATWAKISKIKTSIVELDNYKINISFMRPNPFARNVTFEKIQISPSSITMKDFYPDDPVLEDIMRDIFNKAFDHVLSQ